MLVLDGQTRLILLAEEAARAYANQRGLNRGCFEGTTGTRRNNLKNKHKAFLKRVSKRRAKKGYAHNI